jgi:hypothetical protein
MLLDKENFDAWMERIMDRFDMLERKITGKDKTRHQLNGELLFDNQDLCLMFSISKRTLQRYRSLGQIPFKRINQKTYYLESDVHAFIREHLQKPKGKPGK